MPPKRKSDAGQDASTSKRSRANVEHATAQELITNILANVTSYPIPDDDETIRQSLVHLARYARDLEGQTEQNRSNAGPVPSQALSPEQLAVAVEKIRKAANSGIRKQMTWKPSCKTGSAKWVYDGVCNDPAVFGALLKLGGPPKFKMQKMPKDEFGDALGGISASARYATLAITGTHVNIRWSDSGEFKFSGTYGR
ncbi:hypothetical protein BJ138DRAFT_1147143 [Hygrophoropsis aurantiaca]|uniref:Uncharacterized protein n=1 Tax=Hygrophoropsis aurantiaca TaxID=72124 RepID=A0ACB8AI67_9AGAM|nr:hypothetical protein BJ138DRAFT_1147143 [Hygrophoropsis aurantiaca]